MSLTTFYSPIRCCHTTTFLSHQGSSLAERFSVKNTFSSFECFLFFCSFSMLFCIFFSIFHALIPNFYVLFSIVYSLFFVLGELSGFSTPFSVFYNKGGWVYRLFLFLLLRNLPGFPPLSLFSTTKGWVYRLFLFLLLRNLPIFPPLLIFLL